MNFFSVCLFFYNSQALHQQQEILQQQMAELQARVKALEHGGELQKREAPRTRANRKFAPQLTQLPCPCHTGNAWSARATGSLLDLSAAVTGVESMRRWPELHSQQFWHLDYSFRRNATGAQERYAICLLYTSPSPRDS